MRPSNKLADAFRGANRALAQFAAIVTLVALIAVWPAGADAKCGTGNPLSYDDVSAVLIQHDGCGIGRSEKPMDHFLCSGFWALFSNDSAVDAGAKPPALATYSQYNLIGEVGTYRLDSDLIKAREVLRKVNFFALAPVDVGPDTGEITVTVKRCAVVTRIRASLMPETETPAVSLGVGLMSLIQDSQKTKLSPNPTNFTYDIFFDR